MTAPGSTTATIECSIQETPLDLAAFRRNLPAIADCGGYVSFEGQIRNINHGKGVLRLEYETYDELAVKELRRVAIEAASRFGLKYVRAIHRKGRLEIGESAVIIQVLSRHRREAFDGCRYVIDQLKARVPIWKKEFYDDSTHAWTQCHEHDQGHSH